ncbi:MAG: pyrroline-5-carboxylate reductase [Oscillospiraceae bacterium]|nr:pyrroline-5-carboxylate reductase [Oscillospiraceae bacterium]
MKHIIGFIGAGNMAGAMIGGILKAGIVLPEQAAVSDLLEEKTAPYAARGLGVYADPAELVRNCRYVVLSVKPQVMEAVLQNIAQAVTEEHVLISIAAGVSCRYIRSVIGFECKVVPVMPNTPLLVGEGAVAVGREEPISAEEFDFVTGLFRAGGRVEVIDSGKLNEVIPINGSSPAMIYLLAKYMCSYAETQGISYEAANRLFCQTLIGSAKMMLESGKTHDELIAMVTSPGGTTYRMLDALKERGLDDMVEDACGRCVRRAYELGK